MSDCLYNVCHSRGLNAKLFIYTVLPCQPLIVPLNRFNARTFLFSNPSSSTYSTVCLNDPPWSYASTVVTFSCAHPQQSNLCPFFLINAMPSLLETSRRRLRFRCSITTSLIVLHFPGQLLRRVTISHWKSASFLARRLCHLCLRPYSLQSSNALCLYSVPDCPTIGCCTFFAVGPVPSVSLSRHIILPISPARSASHRDLLRLYCSYTATSTIQLFRLSHHLHAQSHIQTLLLRFALCRFYFHLHIPPLPVSICTKSPVGRYFPETLLCLYCKEMW